MHGALANKPMVPTAAPALNHHALNSWRRHIGQPLGSRDERLTGGSATRAPNQQLRTFLLLGK